MPWPPDRVLSKTTRIETPGCRRQRRSTATDRVLSKTTRIETLTRLSTAAPSTSDRVLSKTTRIETPRNCYAFSGSSSPTESYPRQQGLKPAPYPSANPTGQGPTESYPRQQGLKQFFGRVGNAERAPTESYPRQQGLKLPATRSIRSDVTTADRVLSKTTRIETNHGDRTARNTRHPTESYPRQQGLKLAALDVLNADHVADRVLSKTTRIETRIVPPGIQRIFEARPSPIQDNKD